MLRPVAVLCVLLLLAPSLVAQTAEERLLAAATLGDAGLLQQALDLGASPEAADTSGTTALMLAVHSGSLDALRALLEAGADPMRKGVLWLDSTRTGYYGNLTGIAAGKGHIDVLTFLLDEVGISVEDRERDPATSEATGWTALQWAASAGHTEAARVLMERGAVVDRIGDTLLHLAIRNRHDETVGLLHDAGALVNDADANGYTPLHWAAARLPAVWADRLVAAGVDLNVQTDYGFTPLGLAAYVGDEAFAERLLCHGASGVEEAASIAEALSASAIAFCLDSAQLACSDVLAPTAR